MAWHDTARQGLLGMARRGAARSGLSWRGKVYKVKNTNKGVIMEITSIHQNNPAEMKKPQEILAETILNSGYGEVITHKEIEKIIGIPRKNEHKYCQIIQAAKKILLYQYGKKLESIRGVGYRFVKPGDYVSNSLGHYKRGFREIKKGKDTLDLAPVNDMTAEERATYTCVHDRSIILHASMEGAMCELKTLGKKNHPLLPSGSK